MWGIGEYVGVVSCKAVCMNLEVVLKSTCGASCLVMAVCLRVVCRRSVCGAGCGMPMLTVAYRMSVLLVFERV